MTAVSRLTRQGLLIIVTAAVILELTAIVQFYYAQVGLRAEANLRAESELESTGLEIADVMDQAETAVRNTAWMVRFMLPQPDSLAPMTVRLVENNPVIYGSTIALEPGYYPNRERLFSPYSSRRDGEVHTKMLSSDTYDYTEMEWYTQVGPEGKWSEPYFDTGGGEKLMTTFSYPVRDDSGRQVGVLTADVALDWLTDLVGNVKVYPRAFSMLFSRTGQIMVCPEETLVMHKSVMEVTASMEDTEARRVGDSILAGKSGNIPIRYGKSVNDVFFAPVERAGWSMAIVIPHDEIYRGVKRVGMVVGILQLLGLLMLALILYRTIAGQRKLKKVEERKEKIENELQIASAIQSSMLPKVYPPFPERNDLDVYGIVVPAREVGGDLIDFYIRDDRLFICIGDVSGKGVPASLFMSMTRSMFRTVSARENSPARIVAAMNDSMAELNESNMFVTFFAGILDLPTGSLHYCNAGHNAPIIVSTDGSVRDLPVRPNLPLSIQGGMKYTAQDDILHPGDTLFLFTDGVTEAEDPHHALFGEDRLREVLRNTAGESAQTQVERVSEAVAVHAAGAGQSDDQTLLSVRFLGHPSGKPPVRRIRLNNDIRQIHHLAGFIETIADDVELDRTTALQLNLALEEAVTNVIMYAYPSGTNGIVDIEAVIGPDALLFTVSDIGKPFDPTAVEEVDTSLSAEERSIGGLGIHLVRKIMDAVSYARIDGRNVLTLKKNR